MSAWVLPDHIADVLPNEARHIEDLRRTVLDVARAFGYELVMPPLLEHLDSLLIGASHALDLQTFKLVDQLSGRTLGLRADTTPQVARIDAHLLNRSGVTRLCYCGPVLHTLPDKPFATREPIQFGAEIYGHAQAHADEEILQLSLACLSAAQVGPVTADLSDARIIPTLLKNIEIPPDQRDRLHQALACKDTSSMSSLTQGMPPDLARALCALPSLYGDASVLSKAQELFAPWPNMLPILNGLRELATVVTGAKVSFDLAELRGYDYYSGLRFALYVPGISEALVRGGRYDSVGQAFGRQRPAVGFSFDLKDLVQVTPSAKSLFAIRAPWGSNQGLRDAVQALRDRGETVVSILPGHEHESDEYHCDRELVEVDGRWFVKSL
jgi:ATP phosphoribosyltransferase regulatory subunit